MCGPSGEAFGQQFRWVVGVAGNHDTFGAPREQAQFFRQRPELQLLDGDVVDVDGLRVGGVGGIMGRPDKQGRAPHALTLLAQRQRAAWALAKDSKERGSRPVTRDTVEVTRSSAPSRIIASSWERKRA